MDVDSAPQSPTGGSSAGPSAGPSAPTTDNPSPVYVKGSDTEDEIEPVPVVDEVRGPQNALIQALQFAKPRKTRDMFDADIVERWNNGASGLVTLLPLPSC